MSDTAIGTIVSGVVVVAWILVPYLRARVETRASRDFWKGGRK